MSQLTVNGIRVDDTFAEAFGMRATALTITAHSAAWAHQAAVTMTGFATSVIGCGCENEIDRSLDPKKHQTADLAYACCCSPFPPANCKSNCKTAWSMRADKSGVGLLRGIGSRRRTKARKRAAFLRRRLASRQASRRQTVLAHTGDGRRIHLQRDDRPQQDRSRRGQYHCHG